jgi:hypothetical protein
MDTKKMIYTYVHPMLHDKGSVYITLPKLSNSSILSDERSTLLDSNTILFGYEAVRLVNIAFNTSKLFPSLMSNCDAVSEYLEGQLQRKHPRYHFHIIIAESDSFDFAIDNYVHFADIRHEQYRVVIFSTKPNQKTKLDRHDANNQMKLEWKSVPITWNAYVGTFIGRVSTKISHLREGSELFIF